ncbi:hypothetical protein N7G274_005847 [Stereocaulon virgatum]|uniref:Fanconi-associated nuclease n=1 Tax=Stereocaulon virgatum TaxID=373712 RepID=A0ABR4A6M3_9LECA
MTLQAQSSSFHNQMLGSRIKHPPSTNFNDDFETPTAKRLKRHDSTDSSLSRKEASGAEDEEERETTPIDTLRRFSGEIADSEAETDDDDDFLPASSRKTDLESALPPVKTDKEAIAEYEATRAAEAEDLDLQGRLGQRKWVTGKSSIYVDAFNLALETVLEDESHLFDKAEMTVFEQWRALSYEGQYLYVRLFLRKTAKWHRIQRLGYYGDIADLPAAVKDLLETRKLPVVTMSCQVNPGETEPPKDTMLEDYVTFADSSEDHINTLEEASSLLNLDELKAIAKEAKVQGKNKRELLIALHKASQRQGGLGWTTLKRSDTDESVNTEVKAFTDEEGQAEKGDLHGANVNRDSHFVQKIFSNTGLCIRLSAPALKLFERVHLVFYRSTEWTEKSLTTIILARISRRNFPDYLVSRSTNIFTSRSDLLEFEASIRTQFRIDFILEFNGTVRREGLQAVKDTFEEVYPRWKVILQEEQRKEDRVYESGEGAYLRRFSPAWVYTRIVHKGTYVLGRFKEHEREHQLLTELLDQHLFHAARRGAWYQRKALLEEHYMWAIKPDEGRSEEAQKKYWKKVALQTCEDGLQDKECHVIYHYDLQKRVMKLEKALKVVKREQHDFGHVRLAKPVERNVEGIRIERERTPSRNGNRRDSDPAGSRRGGKTIWVDEREGGGECSVEAMCLSWYRDQGWKGYHSEGGIVRTLFGYLFYDVLFTYIPNVFQTPYQTCPLDLHTDAFYPSRASEINRRLNEISNGDALKLLYEVYYRENEKQTCIVGVDWSFEIDDLQEIVKCFKGEALATVCKVMAQEYQQRGGGIPDLFLWHPENSEVMFSEVKSENDRLSDTQRLWIHVLTGAGIKVELCNAVAREVRSQR